MIEKLGHSKRMQTMRREWINEGKPKDRMAGNETAPKKLAIRPPDSQASKDQMTVANPGMGLQELSVFGDNDNESHEVTPKPHDVEESINDRTHPAESLFVSDGEDLDDQPPEDDLDALLAEDQTKLASSPKTVLPIADAPRIEDDFGDEMEAMAGMEDMW